MSLIDMNGCENESGIDGFHNLTNSKSILEFLKSLSEKIGQLKKYHGVACEAHVILQLIQNCESLILGVKHIEEDILNEAKEMNDRDLQQEINKTHPMLFLSLTKFMDSFRDLYRGDTDVREIPEVWNDIIKYSKIILNCMSHILTRLDQARVIRIIKSLDTLLDSIKALKFSQPEKMLSNFGGIVDKSVVVYSLIYTRAEDTSCLTEKVELRSQLMQLRKTLSILGEVLSKSIRQEATDTKICLRIASNALEDLSTMLRKTIMSSDTDEYHKPGQYSHMLQDIFEVIQHDESERPLPVADRLKDPVTSILQYALSLSHCLKPDEAVTLMLPCQNLLAELKHLTDLEKNTDLQDSSAVEEALDSIVVILEDLEIRFNVALVTLVVNVFTDPYSALDALVRVELGEGEEPKEESTQLMFAFETEVDRLHQVGSFVLLCITDMAIVAEMKSELRILEWLETGLHASFSSRPAPRSSLQTSILNEQWRKCIERIKERIFGLLEPRPVLQIVKEEVHCIWASAMSEASAHALQCEVSRATSLAGLLIALNECRQFLKEEQLTQLERVIEEIKRYDREGGAMKVQSGYTKRLQILLTCVARISHALPERQQIGSSNLSESEMTMGSSGASRLTFTPNERENMFASIFEGKWVEARKAKKPSRNARSKRQQSRHMFSVSNYGEEGNTVEASCELSIDITKFLHSCNKSLTSAHRNSTRSSMPSFTRKFQVVEFDLDDFLKGKSDHKLPSERRNFPRSENDGQVMQNPSSNDAEGPLELKDGSSLQDTPDSINIKTPERLEDLHTAFQRLTALKSVFKVDL